MILDKVDLKKAESILVLYNIELLFALKKRRFSGCVTFFTQSQEKVEIASKILPNVEVEYIDKEENPLYHMENKWPDKFDIIIANPPYSSSLDIKFLEKSFDLLSENGESVFVHPSSIYIDQKLSKTINKSVLEKVGKNIKSIDIFNGNPIFEIGIFPPCAISLISKNYEGQIEVNNRISGRIESIKSIEKLHVLGTDEKIFSTIKKVKSAMENSLQDFVIYDKNVKKENRTSQKEYWVGLSKGRGNVYTSGIKKMNSPMWKDDFFTFTPKGLQPKTRQQIIDLPIRFEFGYIHEAENFIKFLQSDFSRFCLSFLKKDVALNSNMYYVPWMDFTQEWTDEKLYAHFNITEEEQAFIKEVIPPYYD
jgi:hypothetical protein